MVWTIALKIPALMVRRYVTVHGYVTFFGTLSVSLNVPSWLASLSATTSVPPAEFVVAAPLPG